MYEKMKGCEMLAKYLLVLWAQGQQKPKQHIAKPKGAVKRE